MLEEVKKIREMNLKHQQKKISNISRKNHKIKNLRFKIKINYM